MGANDPLLLFMVHPIGYKSMVAMLLAPDEEGAKRAYMKYPGVEELIEHYGIEIEVVNVTEGFAKQGYAVYGYKQGMFH